MLSTLLSPTAAAPLLGPGLLKIARTPTARLAVGYRLVESPAAQALRQIEGVAAAPQHDPGRFVRFLARHWEHAQFQVRRKLGAELEVERLLTGGVVGEVLPLAAARAKINREPEIGQHFDAIV